MRVRSVDAARVLGLTLVLLVARAAAAPPTHPAQPAAAVARTDPNSLAAHAQLLEKRRAGRIDVYFLGVSITRRWGTADEQYHEFYANWVSNFRGWNAADFGWGGDTTWNILWRIEHGELDAVNPRVIVLLAGTNDLTADSSAGMSASEIIAHTVAGLTAVVRACESKAPRATLILTSITPRTDHAELLPLIARINTQLARLADGRRVRYLDLTGRLLDPHGALRPGMLAPDGLHFAVGGYAAWADALRPSLRQLLGPRASVDAAPPPSRDPGAHFPSAVH